jgi:hypothetical protein
MHEPRNILRGVNVAIKLDPLDERRSAIAGTDDPYSNVSL